MRTYVYVYVYVDAHYVDLCIYVGAFSNTYMGSAMLHTRAHTHTHNPHTNTHTHIPATNRLGLDQLQNPLIKPAKAIWRRRIRFSETEQARVHLA